LTDRSLAIRCKDKHHDLGLQQLNVGGKYIFSFYPNYFLSTILFFCHFVWLEGDHHFDIYVQSRDGYCHHDKCAWDIVATGPCKSNSEIRDCFSWNTPKAERRLFVQQNNNI